MKRIGNLYTQICSLDNLALADKKAAKGKSGQYGVRMHRKNAQANLEKLSRQLLDKTFTTSPYTMFKVFDPKEREVYRLPYFPDRIVHHAIMNVLEPYFVSTFTADTYSCIKGKGIHAAMRAVEAALSHTNDTRYCLKLDVRKFYPTIDHDTLKKLLRRKFKDQDLLWLLDNIIDSADGVPIGNYLSQYFANFYLAYFDHWLKEELCVRFYFRYADDLVILAPDKVSLHHLLARIRDHIESELKLKIKDNYQIFPVSARGIDFLGYRFYHTHTMLRKRIKKNFARKLAKKPSAQTIASYNGWLTHANCKNLQKKLLNVKN